VRVISAMIFWRSSVHLSTPDISAKEEWRDWQRQRVIEDVVKEHSRSFQNEQMILLGYLFLRLQLVTSCQEPALDEFHLDYSRARI